MVTTFNGFLDTVRSLFEGVSLPKGRDEFKRTAGELVLEKNSHGVNINGEFIAKENIPDLLTFLATGRLDARKR